MLQSVPFHNVYIKKTTCFSSPLIFVFLLKLFSPQDKRPQILQEVIFWNSSPTSWQGPLPHTAKHFWQMIWEQNSTAILMLNRVVEKNQVSISLLCSLYSVFGFFLQVVYFGFVLLSYAGKMFPILAMRASSRSFWYAWVWGFQNLLSQGSGQWVLHNSNSWTRKFCGMYAIKTKLI